MYSSDFLIVSNDHLDHCLRFHSLVIFRMSLTSILLILCETGAVRPVHPRTNHQIDFVKLDAPEADNGNRND